MVETLIPKSACPSCGHEMDKATEFFDDRARPQPGDVTVCIHCAAVLSFQVGGMRLRPLRADEIARLSPETLRKLQSVRRAVLRLREVGP